MMNRLVERGLSFAKLTFVLAILLLFFRSTACRAIDGGLAQLPEVNVEAPSTEALIALAVAAVLAALGAVAWHTRGPARPRERLASRQRALPQAPRGP